MNEKDLIEKIKNKDMKAFEMIVDKYSKRLFNTIYRFTHNYEDTEDIMQEVWLKFYKSINSFKAQSTIYTYLYRIAINLSINWLRKKKLQEKFKRLLSFTLSSASDPIENVILNEEIEILKAGIEQLPARQRWIFILRQEEKLNFKQIAEILGIKENNAKVSYHYALKNLKKFLQKEGIL